MSPCGSRPKVGRPLRSGRRIATLPFDHDRRMMSVLLETSGGERLLVAKGAPEDVLTRCIQVTDDTRATLEREFSAGGRVVAIATRRALELTEITPADERDLELSGFLVFLDQPKANAAQSLRRLAELGITVKVVTGDNALVAEKVCRELDLDVQGTLTGSQIEALDDNQLRVRTATTTIFARVSPEQKARLDPYAPHRWTGRRFPRRRRERRACASRR